MRGRLNEHKSQRRLLQADPDDRRRPEPDVHPARVWTALPGRASPVKRDRMATAFHPEAVRGLCNQHHGFAHAKPTAFKAHMHRLMGPRYHELQRLSKTVVKGMDYVAKRAELGEILKNFVKKAVNF